MTVFFPRRASATSSAAAPEVEAAIDALDAGAIDAYGPDKVGRTVPSSSSAGTRFIDSRMNPSHTHVHLADADAYTR